MPTFQAFQQGRTARSNMCPCVRPCFTENSAGICHLSDSDSTLLAYGMQAIQALTHKSLHVVLLVMYDGVASFEIMQALINYDCASSTTNPWRLEMGQGFVIICGLIWPHNLAHGEMYVQVVATLFYLQFRHVLPLNSISCLYCVTKIRIYVAKWRHMRLPDPPDAEFSGSHA